MSEIARIESIAELRAFRVALLKFVDACNVALGDAESDMQRTHTWVERDQLSYWNGQLAKRAEMVTRAKEALRMKKLYKSPTGGTQSVVEEAYATLAAAGGAGAAAGGASAGAFAEAMMSGSMARSPDEAEGTAAGAAHE